MLRGSILNGKRQRRIFNLRMNKKKIAIVTGGATGLGYAISKRFTKEEITTIIVGRNKERLHEAAQQLGKFCIAITGDVNQLDQLPALVQKIVDQYGQIDVLVNNAGVNLKKSLVEVTNEEFQKLILTNLTSVFALSREVAKVMVNQKSGGIINISSMAAHYGLPKVIAYTASKAGVEGMTRAMAVELSPLGVRVNCIAPGFIATNMSATALDSDPERKQRVLTRTPMGKLGTPEDVANAAYFLASEESKFMTGAIVPIDGGNSIGF